MAQVFISYRPLSSFSLAQRLYNELTSLEVSTFLDTQSIQENDLLDERIKQEIDRANVVIALVASATFESKWVVQEIEYALLRGKILIPLFQESYSREKPLSFPSTEIAAFVENHVGVVIADQTNQHYDEPLAELINLVTKALSPPQHVLLVDNDLEWLDIIEGILRDDFSAQIEVSRAESYAAGEALIRSSIRFDLAVIDISLESTYDELGLRLAEQLRATNQGATCGLIVLSGYVTATMGSKLRGNLAAIAMAKRGFESSTLASLSRESIRLARTVAARTRTEECFYFRLSFDGAESLRFIDTEVAQGLSITQNRLPLVNPATLDPLDYQRQLVNLSLLREADDYSSWKSFLEAVGDQLYRHLISDSRTALRFGGLLNEAHIGERLLIDFQGPLTTFDVPFELTRIDGQSISTRYLITRRLSEVSVDNAEPFYQFVEALLSDPLRVLLIDPNDDLSAVELISHVIEKAVEPLGIKVTIDTFAGKQARTSELQKAISANQYHICHYLSETGLTLYSENTPPRYDAGTDVLEMLTHNNQIRLIFIESYLGPLLKSTIGTLANAPAVIAFQLPVSRELAVDLAINFYRALFRTFSITDALLIARQAIEYEDGWNRQAKIAPILMQNS